jgi:signal recognition particle receptor subunit beta
MPESGDLEYLARRLEELSAERPEIAARAARIAERVATQRFHIAVLGEFKRGKSTLVNALIGRDLLPSGVVPLTAVATEVHFGTPESTVTFADGRRLSVSPDQITEYVTESGNPSNVKQVERVKLGIEAEFGSPGVVLVDTPGIASVNGHNTMAARAALLDSDAAVLVLSADSPLSEGELAILTELGERRSRVFVVINKSDHLSETELQEVRIFVTSHLNRTAAEWSGPYCIAARSALDQGQNTEGQSAQEFVRVRDALMRFVQDDLAAACQTSAMLELGRLGRNLDQALQIETSARAMDAKVLNSQMARFEAAADDSKRQLEEDCVLLDHEVLALMVRLGRELAERAATEARDCQPVLALRISSFSHRELNGAPRNVIEDQIRERFEPIRESVQTELEAEWAVIARRFSDRVQEHVDGLINVANELFDVHLPAAAVPAVAEQPDRFSYLFLHVEGPNAIIGHFLRWLMPSEMARRRTLRLSQQWLVDGFDKHAGRLRYDLSQRVEATKHRFTAAMVHEFDQTHSSLLGAAQGARNLLALTEDEETARERQRADLSAIAARVAMVSSNTLTLGSGP